MTHHLYIALAAAWPWALAAACGTALFVLALNRWARPRQPRDLEPHPPARHPAHRHHADDGAAGATMQLHLVPDPHHTGPVPAVHVGALDDADTTHFFAAALHDRGADQLVTELELVARVHAEMDAIERRAHAALDAWFDTVMTRLRVTLADLVPARDFDDALTLAGVFPLPAVAVDWRTGEYPVVRP